MEALNSILARIPVMLLVIGYCGWQSYDYYEWLNSPTSEYGSKLQTLATTKQNLEVAKKKLKDAEDFFKNFEALKTRIRQLALELENTKAVLNTEIDLANFVRMLSLEAKKIGLNIKGIRPDQEKKRDFYTEVPFTVVLKGAYVQALVFFDRIAKLQQVIHITDFGMRPSGNVFTKYVELEGTVRVAAFKYLGTDADEIGKKAELSKSVDVNSLDSKGGGK